MPTNDTVIVVGQTRLDSYNNLWVTPQGGGDEVKIAEKRSQLHPLFEQGKAVMLHWETYKNKPYVSDAKLVEGELPPPTKPGVLHQEVIREARASVEDKMTKDDWAKRDYNKNKSIERQKSLDCAKDWCIAQLQAGVALRTYDVLVVAKVFESYLDTGIVVEKKG